MPRILNAALWPIIFFAMAMNSHSLFRKCFCFLWVSLCAACTWHSLCALFLLCFPSFSPLISLSSSPASLYLCLLPLCTWSRDLSANMATTKRVILNLIWPLTHSKCQQQLQQHHHHNHHLLLLLLYPLLLLSLWMLHHVSVVAVAAVAVARLPWWDASRQLSPACLPCPLFPPPLCLSYVNQISALKFPHFCFANSMKTQTSKASERNKKRKSINCVCRQVISSPLRCKTCVNDIWLLRWLLHLHDCHSCEGGKGALKQFESHARDRRWQRDERDKNWAQFGY